MSAYPGSGFLTFLFTDLENSTGLWEQFPESMHTALARHDALLRQAVKTHHGLIVKSTGDGVHAVFESPSNGVAAALAAQQALTYEEWPAETGTLKVRMGVHSGECQERDGDYYGPELNRAARIMGLAYGGQVLVSEVTTSLVRHALPSQASLASLGMHRLKGLAAPEEIFQLFHPDLRVEFPALQSLAAYQHNLPIQLTSFIGRQAELTQITRLLSQTRLLTLLGPGGTGKTRLALQAAAEVLDHFPDGVWLIELAPVSDPQLVPDRVAAALNLQEQPGRPLLTTLTSFMRNRQLLLLLDNVEHLVRACAELSEHLLQHCPSIKILVTGRESLMIEGETTLQIPSLSLPPKGMATPQLLAGSEAAQLFIARAQAIHPDFSVTPENSAALMEVVRRLDGIPLALELAAARLRMMSVEQIAEKLADRFRLLTGGRRTALPRQQTLLALIDWSWNLLGEQEQTLLRRLSVFSGGWTLDAAQVVARADDLAEFDILDLLEQLINKSLVTVEHLPQGEVRYSMLESILQYARDRLLEAGEGAALRDRHAEYLVAFGEEASIEVEGREALAWLERLLREANNASAAREWMLASRLDLALRMTGVSMLVQRYWLFSSEGFRWLDQVVEKARTHPSVSTDPEYRRGLACAIITLGASIFMRGNSDQARPVLEEGIALAQEAGVVRQRVYGLVMLTILLLNVRDLGTAENVAEEALELSRQHGLDFLRQMTLGYYLPVFASHGKYDQAQAYVDEAIRLAHQLGNPWMIAMAEFLSGRVSEAFENWSEAVVSYTQATALFEAVRDQRFAEISRSQIAHMKRKAGDLAGAEELYLRTIVDFYEIGHTSAVAHQLECLGFIATSQGEFTRAARLLGAAQAMRAASDNARLPQEQLEFEQALESLAEAIGETARDAALTQGGQMSVDQAILIATKQ
jgi:predicted ATPase/class 3 adenylate cyclase